jgi:hypothetical protein
MTIFGNGAGDRSAALGSPAGGRKNGAQVRGSRKPGDAGLLDHQRGQMRLGSSDYAPEALS